MAIVLGLIFVGGFACSRATAPTLPGGEKLKILVLFDRGNPENPDVNQLENRNQVGEWMESDLIRILNNGGYEAKLIQKNEEYTPAPGKYLLKIAIAGYSRSFVTSFLILGIHYELFGEEGNPVLIFNDGVDSKRDWTICARKLNKNTVNKVTETLEEIHKQ